MNIQYVSIRIYVLNNGKKVVYKRQKSGQKIIKIRVKISLIFMTQKHVKNRQNLGFWGLFNDFRWNFLKKVEKKCKKMPRKMTFYPVFLTFSITPGGPETRILRFLKFTPRSLGGHLSHPRPKQWSIGAPQGSKPLFFGSVMGFLWFL